MHPRRLLGVVLCVVVACLLVGGSARAQGVLLPEPGLSFVVNGVVEPDDMGVVRVWPGGGPGPFIQVFGFQPTDESITSKKMMFNIMERVLTALPSAGGMPTETLQDVRRAPRVKVEWFTPDGTGPFILTGVAITSLPHWPLLDGSPNCRVYFNDCLQTALRPVRPIANVLSLVVEVPDEGIPAGSLIRLYVGLPGLPAGETGPVIGSVVPGVDPDNLSDSSATLCYAAPRPDLIVDAIDLGTDEVLEGDVLPYSYTVANIGGEGPAGDSLFDVATYLSADQFLDAADIELAAGYSAWSYHLGVGWSQSWTEDDVTIPAGPGTYYLIVLADAKPGLPPNYYPGVVESDETNNWKASPPFTVVGPS